MLLGWSRVKLDDDVPPGGVHAVMIASAFLVGQSIRVIDFFAHSKRGNFPATIA